MRLELLSALSGVLIAAQSRINGALSEQMGDSLEAAIVSFSSGLLFVSLIALSRKDVRDGFKEIFNSFSEFAHIQTHEFHRIVQVKNSYLDISDLSNLGFVPKYDIMHEIINL